MWTRLLKKTADTSALYLWWARLLLDRRRIPEDARGGTRHLLLMTWGFPPAFHGGVFRPAAIAKHGVELGWDVSVLTGPKPPEASTAGEELLRSLPPEVRIDRIRAERDPSYRLAPRLQGGLINVFPTVFSARRLYREKPPSAVLTTGPSFQTFVAAYHVSRYFRVPLILDYRDEWTEGTRSFISVTPFDRRWERKCIAAADAVIFATEGIHDLYLSRFDSLTPEKCRVVHNGWDPEEFEIARSLPPRLETPGGRFSLSFIGRTGTFLPPGSFFDTLASVLGRNQELVDRLYLHFVGHISGVAVRQVESFRRRFPGTVGVTGYVPKSQALRMMLDSSALLMLNDASNTRTLPGKTSEYLAAERPILLYGDTGLMGDVMRKMEDPLVVPVDDPTALATVLQTLVSGEAPLSNPEPRERWLGRHTRRSLVQSILEVVESTVPGTQHTPAPNLDYRPS